MSKNSPIVLSLIILINLICIKGIANKINFNFNLSSIGSPIFQQEPDDDKEAINESDSEEIKRLKKKTLSIKLVGSSEKLFENYMAIADAYQKTNDQSNVLRYLKKARKTNKAIADKKISIDLNKRIADIYFNIGNYQSALDYYMKITDLTGKDESNADYIYASGQTFKINQLSVEKSKQDGMANTKNNSDSITASFKNEVNNYKDLYQSYAKKGDYKKSFEYFKMYQELKDSMVSIENKQNIEKLRNEILMRENNQKIKNLESEAQFHALEKKKNTIFLIALLLVLLLAIGIAILIYGQYKLKNKANQILKSQNKEIMQKNQEITIQKDIIVQQRDQVLLQKVEIEEQKRSITDSILYAKTIQKAFLPSEAEFKKVFADAFIFYRPKDIVSGDFYWLTKQADKLIWAAVDCTGHGVPGAFMSFIGNMLLKEIIINQQNYQADLILNKLRDEVIDILNRDEEKKEMQDGMDLSLCILDLNTRLLSFAGANNSIYHFTNNELIEIKADKHPIGLVKRGSKPFSKQEIQLKQGDLIYSFSDGISDQFGGPLLTKFSSKHLKNCLKDFAMFDLQKQKEKLILEITNWKGTQKQIDDMMLIGVKIP